MHVPGHPKSCVTVYLTLQSTLHLKGDNSTIIGAVWQTVWMWVKCLSTLRLTELLFPCSFGNWSVCVSTLTPTTDLTSCMCIRWPGRCMSGRPAPECSVPHQGQTPLVLLESSPQVAPGNPHSQDQRAQQANKGSCLCH